jgi:hypothetical protein
MMVGILFSTARILLLVFAVLLAQYVEGSEEWVEGNDAHQVSLCHPMHPPPVAQLNRLHPVKITGDSAKNSTIRTTLENFT